MTEKITVWGRETELEIVFDCYGDEEPLPVQQEALNAFLKDRDALLDDALTRIKEYCLQRDGDRIGGSVDNIFRYVKPKALFLKRDSARRTVALLCAYRFDPENGLAAVFRDERFSAVGTENIIL